jgi:glutamate N-acetyltransferase/amino-acid N-acetyltransferase
MPLPVSPLAPDSMPAMPAVRGVRLATAEAGIRYRGRTDIGLLTFEPGTTIAGVLTRSLTAGAPVLWCRRALRGGRARAILVNSGNSNTFTGRVGEETVERSVAATADLLSARKTEIFVASTGVIGEPPSSDKIIAALPKLASSLAAENWEAAARAIMTTDTFPKWATRATEIDGAAVTINGIAKGSGMIAPDMATMLVFVATDARIPAAVLQSLLSEFNETSFNCITVDGDTSTSDTVLLAATGQAQNRAPRGPRDPSLEGFRTALSSLLLDLAQLVVRDGEGATKFVTIDVSGATSGKAARRIALTIANSPLVKTAIAGEDANWGRIVAAVGRSGERADRDRLTVSVGGTLIARNGGRLADYDEGPVVRHMKGNSIHVAVDIGLGRGRATVWTCDLTHGYIDINGSYRS